MCCGQGAAVQAARAYNAAVIGGNTVTMWRIVLANGRQSRPFPTRADAVEYLVNELGSRGYVHETQEPKPEETSE